MRIFHADLWDTPAYEREMRPEGDAFCAKFTPEVPELLFYEFFYDGVVYRKGEDAGAVADLCAHYQLTVYEGNEPITENGGVVYQVFPDRFFQSGERPPCPFPDRRFYADRGELPEWRPDENGDSCKDYFGGNLRGITEKLDYLASLSVTELYLNPIFEAHSNHRYNISDYTKIDILLGTERDFALLCEKAHRLSIKILLDGVFNHTGSDSVYFNARRRYPGPSASDPASPYHDWYTFGDYPYGYRTWWNFPDLPAVDGSNPDWQNFLCAPGGVIEKWLSLGADGFRLDVADELDEELLRKISAAVHRFPGALLIGEVWEDASNKISYGKRRHYFLGGELDGVMNYPVRTALLGWLKDGTPLRETLLDLYENYPAPSLARSWNLLSTHDTERALTFLGCEPLNGHDREWQAAHHIPSSDQYEAGKRLLIEAFAAIFTLPGTPCVYYGDEAGLYGYGDPFCRCCYPWGNEDAELREAVSRLGKLRKEHAALMGGSFRILRADEAVFAFERAAGGHFLLTMLNRSLAPQSLPEKWEKAEPLFGQVRDGTLAARETLVLLK
ncbi:MAG TPA: glycoside hydrolase family 13 protein [Oscillospiraceae bacterium]|nr:glycoside hydrolase family 13 protein [Oscillospiraceae bacterium]